LAKTLPRENLLLWERSLLLNALLRRKRGDLPKPLWNRLLLKARLLERCWLVGRL
jgi:hypothetical protein